MKTEAALKPDFTHPRLLETIPSRFLGRMIPLLIVQNSHEPFGLTLANLQILTKLGCLAVIMIS